MASFALLVAGWVQGLSQEPVWYNAVLLGAAVTVAGAFASSRYTAWRDRKSRRKALLAAYLGEMSVIREELRVYLEQIRSQMKEQNELPEMNRWIQPAMPKKVFEGTVGILGEIGDAQLVEDIANLYAQIERAQENTRGLVEVVERDATVPQNYLSGHYSEHIVVLAATSLTLPPVRKLLKRERQEDEEQADRELIDDFSVLLESDL